MSGKNKKKKPLPKSKAVPSRRPYWIALAVLFTLLMGLLVFVAYMESREVPPEETLPGDAVQEEPSSTGTAAPESESMTVPDGIQLGSDVIITEILPYTGAFMEDRTDEVVTDVLALRITNAGDCYVQAMDITLVSGEVTAEFSLSTLFPGQSIIVLEKNRMAYSTAPEFTEAKTSSVALFDAHPGMAEDKLQIQCLDGVINIINTSGEDIPGDILVYYKNYVGGVYYGGITYRLRIEGGLKAGEIRQGAAAHFHPSNTQVVFVTCG